MSEDYIVRKYQPGDEIQIVKVLDEVFEGWPKVDLELGPLSYWLWKYQENIVDERLVVFAEKGDMILGVGHTVPMRIKIHDKIILGGLGGDVAVLKEFRRIGIRNRTLVVHRKLRVEKGLKFTCAITGNPIVVDMFERSPVHHKFPISLSQYVKINDVDLHMKINPMTNEWIQKLGFQALKTLGSIKSRLLMKDDRGASIEIMEVKEFDDSIDDFWMRCSEDFDLMFVRDKDFLNWRYCDVRAGYFKIFTANVENKIVGYIVLRVNGYNERYPVGYICDLLSSPYKMQIIDTLLNEAVRFFDEKEVNIVNMLERNTVPYGGILQKYGFVNSRRGHHIYYSPLLEENPFRDAKDVPQSRTYFSYGDFDII